LRKDTNFCTFSNLKTSIFALFLISKQPISTHFPISGSGNVYCSEHKNLKNVGKWGLKNLKNVIFGRKGAGDT